MRKSILIILCIKFFNISYAQNYRFPEGGGEYVVSSNYTECLNEEQRMQIKQKLQASIIQLKSSGVFFQKNKLTSPLIHPLFIWPVTKSATTPYNNVWSISNHVDHNPNFPNAIQDWNCGSRTYDTSSGYNHKGIDIFTWPFSLFQMDNNQAIAVAAADGVIIGKDDGNYDRSCSFNSNNWNAVYVSHADGSQTWYGHLKNGSLTSKNLGDTVVAGEFLGVVGSSGNSTGPHLHFEVYNNLNQLVDTYTGTCNTWTSSTDSWWQSQKPYWEPKINAVLTHSTAPQFNSCPTSENPNLNDNFTVGSNVVVGIYLADQLAGTSVNLVMRRPDNSVLANWNFNLVDQYYASWWYWTFSPIEMSQQLGTYQFTATYQGNSITHSFNYGNLGINENFNQKFDLFPNPSDDLIMIKSKDNSQINSIKFFDLLGKEIVSFNNFQEQLSVSSLSNGIYLIKIATSDGVYSTKFIKK